MASSRPIQIECFCLYCSQPFLATPSRIAKGFAQCCSTDHKWDYQAQQQLAHFWDNVDQSGGPDACWPWTGSTNKSRGGYGQFFLCGKLYRANRMAFILVKGPLGDEEQALHTCDNPPCCNPSHLFKGTHQDNMKDRNSKGRQAKGDNTPPENRPRGERHGRAVLTEVTARECYALKGQMSQESAGRQFHIDQTVVSDLWNHMTWRHIHANMD